ncbi:hypothetical protein TWF192_005734 [Orbilia oligospora]|uniref:Uncharacterized protein n=1 Tax=Orbilia oligospora TaxID=2813651 RepID=A0A6G1MNN6_ORBOL|nr:hypothetical protein TWF191_003905 [Orbilia oligospora]KAF3263453.1 hypothetical protein TWF192_005734 [Orbilia oligospora]
MAEYLRRVNRDRGVYHEPTAPYAPGSSTNNIQSDSGYYAASPGSETTLNGPQMSDDVEGLYLTSDPLIANFARGTIGLQNQKRRLLRNVVHHLVMERRCIQGELEMLRQENSRAQETVTNTSLEAEKYRSKTVKLKEIIQNLKRDHDKELETLRNELDTINNKRALQDAYYGLKMERGAYFAIFLILLLFILLLVYMVQTKKEPVQEVFSLRNSVDTTFANILERVGNVSSLLASKLPHSLPELTFSIFTKYITLLFARFSAFAKVPDLTGFPSLKFPSMGLSGLAEFPFLTNIFSFVKYLPDLHQVKYLFPVKFPAVAEFPTNLEYPGLTGSPGTATFPFI